MAGDRKFAAFDKSGNRYEVTAEVWRNEVLPSLIKQSWRDADALYSIVVVALADGFFAEAFPGAKRLIELEPASERAALVLANTQWKLGQVDESLFTVQQFHARSGPTATSLAHLATLAAARGDLERAAELLWQALLIDPNDHKAASWWPLLERDRNGGGRDAQVAALRRLAELPGSWRALVGLARVELDEKQIDKAIAFFEEALRRGPEAGDLLLTVSGDLGNAGRLTDALRLVLPHYDSRRHDPIIGLNLLQAAISARDLDLATRVLAGLEQLDRWDLKARLLEAKRAIDEVKQSRP